jgi:hypothetical protein
MKPPKLINVVEAREEQRLLANVRSMSQAAHDVLAERYRQQAKEGWSAAHDDEHTDGSLADAAACYAATTRPFKAEEFAGVGYRPYTCYSDLWPKSWADHWFKPRKSRRRKLIVAAALIIAEIERLDRTELLNISHRPEGE